jgi:hypothetical protein
MTFKEYLNKIGNDLALIEEWCGDRLVAIHTTFGLGDVVDTDDGEEDKSNYFQLWGHGQGGDDVTEIDIHQEIVFNKKAVCVMDTNGNKLDLFFYRGELIQHPSLDK